MNIRLSILLPSYNNVCTPLVRSLQSQCAALAASEGLNYEIIVADDGSDNAAMVGQNRSIEGLQGCRFIRREHNVGRAAIRNFLAREARGELLLFIDSDRNVRKPDFVKTYLSSDSGSVVYGGYVLDSTEEEKHDNLRCRYEMADRRNANAELRRDNPYMRFCTTNFSVRREVMLRHPFDERIRSYGYEDVLWGKTLRRHGIGIVHIDNPVCLDKFETNPRFVAKTTEAMHTLFRFRDELRGYSSVVHAADRLRRVHLLPLAALAWRLTGNVIKRRLEGNKPSLFLFNTYKMLLFCSLFNDNRHTEEPLRRDGKNDKQ